MIGLVIQTGHPKKIIHQPHIRPCPVDDCPLLASVSSLSKGSVSTLTSYQTYSLQMGKDREDELYPWCTGEGFKQCTDSRKRRVGQILPKINI